MMTPSYIAYRTLFGEWEYTTIANYRKFVMEASLIKILDSSISDTDLIAEIRKREGDNITLMIV